MRFFGAHSRLLGLVTHTPLGHASLQTRACASASKSTRNFRVTRPPSAVAYSTKMFDGSDLDNFSSDDSEMRRPSTVDDVLVITLLLKEITGLMSYRGRAGLGDVRLLFS